MLRLRPRRRATPTLPTAMQLGAGPPTPSVLSSGATFPRPSAVGIECLLRIAPASVGTGTLSLQDRHAGLESMTARPGPHPPQPYRLSLESLRPTKHRCRHLIAAP